MLRLQVCCVALNRQPAGSALSSFEVRVYFDAGCFEHHSSRLAGKCSLCARHFLRQIWQHVRETAFDLFSHFDATFQILYELNSDLVSAVWQLSATDAGAQSTPQSLMVQRREVLPSLLPHLSTCVTMPKPSTTFPNTTCLPSR
jgi:hypothetical protein